MHLDIDRPRDDQTTDPPAQILGGTQRVPLHDGIVHRLRDMILHGPLTPGMPLIEAELCGTVGVSRTPLREALKVLAAEGLVTLRAHRSPIIARIDAREIAEIFDVLVPLECLAGRLATQRDDPAARDALLALHHVMRHALATQDRAAYFRGNDAFHASFARQCGNAVLQATLLGLQGRVQRARASVNADPERWHTASAEHAALVAAFCAGDSDGVSALLEAHLRGTADAVLRALRVDGMALGRSQLRPRSG